MASLLKNIVKAAQNSLVSQKGKDLQYCLTAIKDQVAHLKCEDIDFHKSILEDNRKFDPGIHDAPVTYVGIFENENFSIGIFIVRNGQRLPLHDHPNMSGVLKLIHGKVTIESYTEDPNQAVPEHVLNGFKSRHRLIKSVIPNPKRTIDTTSEPCVLTPTDSNFHEIRAVGGTAAFFDILFPPYDQITGSRLCKYYKVIGTAAEESVKEPSPKVAKLSHKPSPFRYIMEVPQPSEFWCDSLKYLGPKLGDFDD